jgi:hypothetical protein
VFFDWEEDVRLRLADGAQSMVRRFPFSVKFFRVRGRMESVDKMVEIEGDGVAAACCAQLFSADGQTFTCSRVARPRLGSVLLSRQTLLLLSEIFPAVGLVSLCHPIQKRIVAWGPDVSPVTLAHSAWVVSEADLLSCLWQQITVPVRSEERPGGWKVLASCPQQRAFGTRTATVVSALLKQDADQTACWIESVASGWLFLLPRGPEHTATLISVGEAPAVLLGQSRLIAGVVDTLSGPAAEFPAYPRIASPICGDGWLACGAAAMAFDPLCGEGTGNAARQAYLATAVVGAVRDDQPVEELLTHYTSRQMYGFLRHLQICSSFYQTGGSTSFWESETALLRQGIEWAVGVLREDTKPATHRLVGRQLEPIVCRETLPRRDR